MSEPKTLEEIYHACKVPKSSTTPQVASTAKNKMGNRWVVIDNIKFQSTGEGYYYLELKEQLLRGYIKEFKRQVPFEFFVNGVRVGKYVADFATIGFDGNVQVIDYKSRYTLKLPLYQIKKALMLACYQVVIKEVGTK